MQGAWGGKGVKKPKNAKKFTRKVAGIEVAKRHDFGKSNVIISERKDKKAAKYQTKDLPYPYTSAAQYEASLSQAVGTEWATRGTHQKLTLPRVVTKVRSPRVLGVCGELRLILPSLADGHHHPPDGEGRRLMGGRAGGRRLHHHFSVFFSCTLAATC